MAELVYPPIIGIVKTLWKYLGLQFTFYGEAHVPKKGAAILAMNHVAILTSRLPVQQFCLRGALFVLWPRKKSLIIPLQDHSCVE